MKIYKTQQYKNYKGKSASNDVLILNDEERNTLALKLVHMLDKINNEKIIINHHDQDIILFLFTTLHFHHNGQMLDILKTQLLKIDKLIWKVYKKNFIDWFEEADYEGEITSKHEMFQHMQRKRNLENKYTKEIKIRDETLKLKDNLRDEVLSY